MISYHDSPGNGGVTGVSVGARGGGAEKYSLQLETVSSVEGFMGLATEWNRLFEAADNPSPPLHHDWLSLWLEVYGPKYASGRDPLRVVCFRRDGQLVGALPMYLRRPSRVADGGTHLMFISTGEQQSEEVCPDYMDLLALSDVRAQCAEMAWRHICTEMSGDYDRVELSDMADCSPMVSWARDAGAQFDLEISPRGACPMSELNGGIEAYISRLPYKMRQQTRRLLRIAGESNVSFAAASAPEEIELFYRELIELHQRRWVAAGEMGVFTSPLFTQFHRRLCERWIPQGRAMLSRIQLDGQTVGMKYGFRVRDKFDFYQSGIKVEETAVLKSPGTVSLLMLMKHLAEQGVNCFDFLRGSSFYKQRLATGAQPLVQVRRVLWTWRTSVGFVADLSSRCVRKAGRIVKRKRAVAPLENSEDPA